MKTVKKQVSLKLEELEMNREGCGSMNYEGSVEYKYTFTTYQQIPNIETLQHFVEVQEPETVKEFREENNLSKDELTKWLNKNYHKNYIG